MAYYQWDDRYSVKIKQFDLQHKKLLDMVSDLYKAMQEGKGRDVLAKVLTGLIEYTISHFSAEEELMTRYNFPGLEEHRQEHAALTKKVLQVQSDYQAGKMALSVELSNFLKDWVLNHILGTDQKYSDFLNSKGVK